jgi:uncharacterized protein YecT (DUF1311 family)
MQIIKNFFFPLLISSALYSQKETKEQIIDRQLNECLASSEEKGIKPKACYNQTLRIWEAELNEIYMLLLNVLSKDNKSNLENVQKKWLEYKDSELVFAIKTLEQGGMEYALQKRNIELTKLRTLDLKNYYNFILDNSK